VVLAQLAGAALAGHAEVVEIASIMAETDARAVRGEVVHPRGQRGAVGAHQARDVGTDDLDAGLQLEGPQHRVVEERAALDDHLVAELGRVAQLHHLVQRVADDRVAQPGGDVGDRGALLLGLLDRGVHEHGAAAAQVDRVLGGQPEPGELAHVGAHGLGEGLQERAAAGRAGLVDRDRVDGAVADLQVLHVLAADVDDAGHPWADRGGGPEVGHRLDLALVGVQGRLDQFLRRSR
jgi:hypothetical protein